MHYKEPENRNQMKMCVCLDDYIHENNSVRIIDAFVENIVDNNPDKFEYKGKNKIGQKAYSPKTFLKLYVYGYSNGITSSRKLETETNRNIEVKWLLGNLQPDFKTIADYRKDNREQVEFVAQKIRQFLEDKDLIEGELVAIDGTKVKANANRNMLDIKQIKKKLKSIDERIDEYLEQIEIEDIEEELVEENNISETSEINKEAIKKIAKLQQRVEELEEAKSELENSDKNYISLTDKDTSLMKIKGNRLPGYNIQAAVDWKNMMIMNIYPTDSHTDLNEIRPMVNRLESEYLHLPSKITLDKGYYNLAEITDISIKRDTEFYLPIKDNKSDNEDIKFEYDKERDVYICSEGEVLELIQKNKMKKGTLADVYRCKSCDGCKKRDKCTSSKYGRMKHRYKNQEWRDNFKEKMKKSTSKEIIEKRKSIVEHVFGTIKYWMGQIPLKLRGLKKVGTEMSLYSTAYNIKRLKNILDISSIVRSIEKYNWKVV